MHSVSRILLLAFSVILLAGCGSDDRELREWVAQVKQRSPEPIEPIPPMRVPEEFEYAAHDLRDPFVRSRPRSEDAVAGTGDGVRPDPERRREYLEGYPLDTLAMVGTIELEGNVFGLISDGDGVVHRVREGNYLGQNHGRIHRIHEDRVELVELIPDGAEGWMEREAQIALNEADSRG